MKKFLFVLLALASIPTTFFLITKAENADQAILICLAAIAFNIYSIIKINR